MIFQYKPEYYPDVINPKKSSRIFRPNIQIHFNIKNKLFPYSVLIDSGSDFCIFHSHLARDLGIDLKKGVKITFKGTSNRKQTAYFHKIAFIVGNKEVEALVAFSDNIKSLPFGLLGQQGFFDKFKVSFDLKKKVIEII